MVLPLSRLNSIGYDNKPDSAWDDYYYAQAFPEESSLQRGGNVPFYRGPVLERGYGLGSIFKSVARSVMPSLKEIGKSALTTGLEVLQDVAQGENIKTAAKKRLTEENSLAFLTPYNVGSVLWRLFSTLEVVQYIGGITSVLWGDSFSTVGG